MPNMANMPRVGPGGQQLPMQQGNMVGNQMGMGGMGPMGGQQNPNQMGGGNMPGQMGQMGGQMQMMNNMVPIPINAGMGQNAMNVCL